MACVRGTSRGSRQRPLFLPHAGRVRSFPDPGSRPRLLPQGALGASRARVATSFSSRRSKSFRGSRVAASFSSGCSRMFFLVHPNSSSSFLSQLDDDLFSAFHPFAEFNLRLGLSTSPFWSPSRPTSSLTHLSETFLEQLYQGEITLSLELEAFNSDILSKVSKN